MREIKFRGYDPEEKKWIYGDLFHDRDCFGNMTASYIYEFDASHGRSFQHEVIPETVGQFTGLTDKNGVEIYDGDIVKDKFDGGYTVDYCDDWGAFRAKIIYDKKRFFIAGSQSFIGNAWREWEVIGNIHDNPELLEAPHDNA